MSCTHAASRMTFASCTDEHLLALTLIPSLLIVLFSYKSKPIKWIHHHILLKYTSLNISSFFSPWKWSYLIEPVVKRWFVCHIDLRKSKVRQSQSQAQCFSKTLPPGPVCCLAVESLLERCALKKKPSWSDNKSSALNPIINEQVTDESLLPLWLSFPTNKN